MTSVTDLVVLVEIRQTSASGSRTVHCSIRRARGARSGIQTDSTSIRARLASMK
jgi:hypothetical protein